MQDKNITRECKHHGPTQFVLETTSGYYRCKQCRVDNVTKRRRKVKRLLVADFGGKCIVCGYDRCVQALQFHHLDRDTKEFGISGKGNTLKYENLKKEADKCILVCANCHFEIENGIIVL